LAGIRHLRSTGEPLSSGFKREFWRFLSVCTFGGGPSLQMDLAFDFKTKERLFAGPLAAHRLCDSSPVASSCSTSQCSVSTRSAMRTMSAAIQLRGRPWPEKRPWTVTNSLSARIHAVFVSQRWRRTFDKIKRPSRARRNVGTVLDIVG
jgi:hypothetical protein